MKGTFLAFPGYEGAEGELHWVGTKAQAWGPHICLANRLFLSSYFSYGFFVSFLCGKKGGFT